MNDDDDKYWFLVNNDGFNWNVHFLQIILKVSIEGFKVGIWDSISQHLPYKLKDEISIL